MLYMASNKVKDILEENRSLAEQMRDYQQRAARDSFAQGQRGLSEQLRGQRANMQQNREQLSQQAMLAQRNIQQGATQRGLGSSGIRDLATIQSQMAQGDALRNLTSEDASVQRAAMDTRLSLAENLRAQLMGTEAQYTQQMLDVDRFGLEREDMDRDTLMQLIEMASSGEDEELIRQLASVAFGDIGAYFEGSGLEQEAGGLEDLLDSLSPGFDKYGDQRFSTTQPTEILEKLAWIDPGKYGQYLRTLSADLFRDSPNKKKPNLTDIKGTFGGVTSAAAVLKGKPDNRFYKIDGKRVSMSSDEIYNFVNDKFGSHKYVKNGDIEIVKRKDESGGTNIKFVANGKTYSSFNKAKNALDALKKNNK